MFQSFRHVIIAVIPYTLVLIAMRLLGYIDFSVALRVYLPIFLLAVPPLVFKKQYIGHVFLAFASLGLIAEYLLHLKNPDAPSMAGVMLNMIFLVAGVFLGAAVQFVVDQRKKRGGFRP